MYKRAQSTHMLPVHSAKGFANFSASLAMLPPTCHCLRSHCDSLVLFHCLRSHCLCSCSLPAFTLRFHSFFFTACVLTTCIALLCSFSKATLKSKKGSCPLQHVRPFFCCKLFVSKPLRFTCRVCDVGTHLRSP